jgi:hypothetical protein
VNDVRLFLLYIWQLPLALLLCDHDPPQSIYHPCSKVHMHMKRSGGLESTWPLNIAESLTAPSLLIDGWQV